MNSKLQIKEYCQIFKNGNFINKKLLQKHILNQLINNNQLKFN